MKKKYFVGTLLAGVLSLSALSGCIIKNQEARGIVSIEKTETIGKTDYYTITYTDGTTSGFTVQNGTDGKDAQEVSAEDVYETYKKIYPEENLSFADFCQKFLSVDTDGTSEVDYSGVYAINSVLCSTLKVYTVFKESDGLTAQDACYSGSSVIYKMGEEYTYLLTNYHVVYNPDSLTKYDNEGDHFSDYIYAYLYGSEDKVYVEANGDLHVGAYGIKCEYIGGSISYDVALLKVKTQDIKNINPQAKPVTVNTNYTVGEQVFAVGNPNTQGISVTRGIISVYSENSSLSIDNGLPRTYRVLRTDADLDHGSSGGGLFNLKGEYIALCNSGSEIVQSINNGIPAMPATSVADGIIEYYLESGAENPVGTKKMLLGVTVTSLNSRYEYDEALKVGTIKEDVTVSETALDGGVNPALDSPASPMGLHTGDIIKAVTIGGTTYNVNCSYDLGDALLTARVGDAVKITYERDGVTNTSTEYIALSSDLIDVA